MCTTTQRNLQKEKPQVPFVGEMNKKRKVASTSKRGKGKKQVKATSVRTDKDDKGTYFHCDMKGHCKRICNKYLSDSGIGLSAHLSSPLIFSYIRTYVLYFSIYDSRVSSSHRQHGIRAIISSRRRRHQTLQSSFSACRLFLLRCNIISFLVYRHHHYQAFSSSKPRAPSAASLYPTLHSRRHTYSRLHLLSHPITRSASIIYGFSTLFGSEF